MLESLHVLITTVFFHCIMWKKQAPNACFNLFLVLLLSPESVAFYLSVNAPQGFD
jgi:hypothetical protein